MDSILWLKRWGQYLASVAPHREDRFDAVLEILDVSLEGGFTLVDLGCGPGRNPTR